jgi:hypothetical protein
MENNYLQHYGVLGMKWGVRRSQSKNGSSTPAGKKRYSEDHVKVQKIRKKKVSQMSNQELRDANNRLQLERQYGDLTKKKSRGKQAVQTFIAVAGTIAAAEGAYNTYKRVGKKVLEAIGDSKL